MLKCKLCVNISCYTVYSTSHCSKALAIFGFTFKKIRGVTLLTAYNFMKKNYQNTFH